MATSSRSNKSFRSAAALVLTLLGFATQAHADNLNPILGGGLGAMAGALIGQSVGGREGAMIGAVVGGVAGVSISSEWQHRGYEPARTVVYDQPYRQAPGYGYRAVERVAYYPGHDYGHNETGGTERGWARHDEFRRSGEHRGWERRD